MNEVIYHRFMDLIDVVECVDCGLVLNLTNVIEGEVLE